MSSNYAYTLPLDKANKTPPKYEKYLMSNQLILNRLENKKDKVNIGALTKGIYLISLNDQETGEKIMTRKLLKE